MTKKHIIIGMLAVLILLPSIGLLQNGLDQQRMWDTNVTAAFHFLNAAKNGQLKDFFSSYQKYPLLGSYALVPAIGIYYFTERLLGNFSSAQDFVNTYALRESRVFFAIRLQMLIFYLLSLLLLYSLTRRFTENSTKAGLYTLLFAGLNFSASIFSVVPRIHSFGFFTTTLTLYASFLLLENKKARNYLFAFGAATIAFSTTQSGVIAFIMPFLAHFFNNKNYLNKKLIYSIIFFTLFSITLGYPKILTSLLQEPFSLKNILLTGSHQQPEFALTNFVHFLKTYFLRTDLITAFLLLVGFVYAFIKKKIKITAYDIIAFAHVCSFFLLFGFTDVISNRFMLVILPSLFFLMARIITQTDKKRWVFYPFVFLLLIYFYGWWNLTSVAFGGDSREQATQYLLQHTDKNDAILSNLDKNLLGITATPESIISKTAGSIGSSDILIAERNLTGYKSRNFTWWNTEAEQSLWPDPKQFKYIVISGGDNLRLAEDYLSKNDFVLAETFFSKRNKKDFDSIERIPWDTVQPELFKLLPIKLSEFEAMGSNLFIFQQK